MGVTAHKKKIDHKNYIENSLQRLNNKHGPQWSEIMLPTTDALLQIRKKRWGDKKERQGNSAKCLKLMTFYNPTLKWIWLKITAAHIKL